MQVCSGDCHVWKRTIMGWRRTIMTAHSYVRDLCSNCPNNPDQRSEGGLTTLEWLLIVAAVAGLAALAVVLVQNVVDETAEEISGNNARKTAAEVAAARITSDARAELPSNPAKNDDGVDDWEKHKATQESVNNEYGSKCNRLKITYSDAQINSTWAPAELATGAGATASGTRSNHDSKGKTWATSAAADRTEASCTIS